MGPVSEPTDDREDAPALLDALVEEVRDEFEATAQILSFEEWLVALLERPRIHARGAAGYLKDALDYYGRRPARIPSGEVQRFRLFDTEFDGGHRLVGQERAQNLFYEVIEGFVRMGRVDRLVLLVGPNGSAKSTFLETIQRALEAYSRTEEGALYRFAWVFPNKQVTGGGIGFGADARLTDALGASTYARLGSEDIDARLVDEHKDHPLLLLPPRRRRAVIEAIERKDPSFVVCDALRFGELSHRNRRIFDALLASYQGDVRKVLRHVQVERLVLSRKYRQGLVTVEPKQTTDARSFPVTGDAAYARLPPAVTGQPLYAVRGDLVDANRGVIDYSDMLKRPYEHYKYLLTATETGKVALEHVVIDLDMVFTGSANDLNLAEFRVGRPGEYQSFRGRMTLIRVPLLRDYRVERKIYEEQIADQLRGIHVAPHVTTILALWGVMTRLRRPNADRYPRSIRPVIERLTPLEKADLYSYGRVPRGLSSDEARELLAQVPALYDEPFSDTVVEAEGTHHWLGDYEGSFGASVRDLKNILLAAASEAGVRHVTVPAVFREIEVFLEDARNHRWMLLEPDGPGYHALRGEGSITAAARERWRDMSDREIREALGLVDEQRYLELFRRYVVHASHATKKERLYDEVTGELREPDEAFMRKLEDAMVPGGASAVGARDEFRKDVIARIGAWALSHPDEEPAYEQIFPDYFAQLREDYYRRQKETVRRAIERMLELLGTEDGDEPPPADRLSPAEEENARHALRVLLGDDDRPPPSGRGHTRMTLKETLVDLLKSRY